MNNGAPMRSHTSQAMHQECYEEYWDGGRAVHLEGLVCT